MHRRSVIVGGIAGIVTLAATPAAAAGTFPVRIELPNGFPPEGIAIDRGTAFFGSRTNGDIYAADLRTGAGKVISAGPGTGSLGMKTDGCGRLYVAGAAGGNGRLIDIRTGRVLASYQFTTATPTFVNDVILTGTAAWFTESRQPQLYQVPYGKQPVTVPLSGEMVHDPNANNANGIVRTPDGRALVIVQSSTGFLFRVEPRTGVTTKVDIGDAVLTNGDGMLLVGRTLFVVQNRLNKIAVLDLAPDGRKGRLVREITSPDFDVPTTVAAFGNRLYLPNARFTVTPAPDTPYWVTAVNR